MLAYLDNSATTRPLDEVTQRMLEINSQYWANPSSLHSMGLDAERILKEAREISMSAIGAKEGRFIFTSGGTEADNLALSGTLFSAIKRKPKLVISKIEHPAISEPAAFLADLGVECRAIGVNKDGVIDLEEFEKSLEPDTALVSVMLVNNEVGSIQPIAEISKIMKKICPEALLHTDAVQGFGKVPIDVDKMGIDLLTVSGHKINGPKGIGGLYVRHPNRLKPIVFGGHQEENFRSGTENTAAIGGFAVAVAKTIEHMPKEIQRLSKLRDRITASLREIKGCHMNGGDRECSAPHIVNASFVGTKSEVLLHSLERCRVFVSTGSACSSNKPSYSHVLKEMGVGRKEIDGSIRLSLGVENTVEQIDYALQAIHEEVANLRALFG